MYLFGIEKFTRIDSRLCEAEVLFFFFKSYFSIFLHQLIDSINLPHDFFWVQGVITQLSDQISTLNERMDEFTSRIEELNSKFANRKVSVSQQNLALQAEASNGSGPTSLFVNGLGNGSLTGSLLPNSSSSSQLARESPLLEEVIFIIFFSGTSLVDFSFSIHSK